MNSTDIGTDTTGGGEDIYGAVTPGMVRHLQNTKPWVRLISIVGFAGTGLMVLAALFRRFAGASLDPGMGMGGGVGFVISFVYLLSAVIYFFTSLYLFRYAGSIQALVTRLDGSAMEEALGHQKSFWQLVGIVIVVYLVLIGVALLAALAGMLFSLGR